MKKIELITVGTLKEFYWKSANEEYLKRLSKYCDIRITEVAESRIQPNNTAALIDKVLAEESTEIKRRLNNATAILLDIQGKSYDSLGWAELLRHYYEQPASLAFIIGGSHGVSAEIKNIAAAKVSFSAMTFPHQLFRTMFLEQLYRGFRILHNEPYHK